MGNAVILLMAGGLLGWVVGVAIGFLIPVSRRWLAPPAAALALAFWVVRGWYGDTYDVGRRGAVFIAGMLALGLLVGFFGGTGRGRRLREGLAGRKPAH